MFMRRNTPAAIGALRIYYTLPGYPKRLLELTMHDDKAVSSKAMAAMMK